MSGAGRTGPTADLGGEVRAFLEHQRVAHLASADADGVPHVIPVCYAVLEACLYVVIDAKPKRARPQALKRVRNILANPRVAVVVDHYDDDDWQRLGWVLLHGQATLLEGGAEHTRALAALRQRYRQYRDMPLDAAPVIAVRIERVSRWGRLQAPGRAP